MAEEHASGPRRRRRSRQGWAFIAGLLVTGVAAVPGTFAGPLSDTVRRDPASTVVEAPLAAPATPRPPFEVAPVLTAERAKAAVKPVAAGFDEQSSRRNEQATTPTAEVFNNVDGSQTAVLSPYPVRFRESKDEAWQVIDLDIDATVAKRSTTARHRAKRAPKGFPTFGRSAQDGVVTFGQGDNVFTVRHEDAEARAGKIDGRDVHFKDALSGGRDLVEHLTPTGFEEDVVLPDADAPTSYEVKVDLPAAATARNGGPGVELVGRKGDVLASVAVGWAYDSTPRFPNRTVANVELLGVRGRVATIEVSIDPSFLEEPSTVFPVTIDPVFTTYTATSYGGKDTSVITTFNNQPSPYWSDPFLYVGKVCYGICWQARALLKWDLGGLPSDLSVSSANLRLVNTDTYQWTGSSLVPSCTNQKLQVRNLTGSFTASTVDSNRPGTGGWSATSGYFAWSEGSSSCPVSSSSVVDIDLTSFARSWLEVGVANNGISIENSNESSSYGYGQKFYSGDVIGAPTLTVTYTVPPPPPPPPATQADLGRTDSGSYLEDPVNVMTGNMVDSYVDLPAAGEVPGFEWARTYNLFDTTVGDLGRGWSSTYSPVIAAVSGNVEMSAPDGRRIVWAPQPSGVGYIPPREFAANLSVVSGNYVVTFIDGTVWKFDSAGRLVEIDDPAGHATTITRASGTGRLQTVTSGGMTMAFTYGTSGTGAGRITSVTGPAGTVSYQYSSAGNLIGATDVGGHTTVFGYDSSNRQKTITDPTGVVLVSNTFDSSNRVVAQAQTGGATTTFTYGGTDSVTGLYKTVVTDSVTGAAGAVTYLWDANHQVRKIRDNLPKPEGAGTGNEAIRTYGGGLGVLSAATSRLEGTEQFEHGMAYLVTCEAEVGASCPSWELPDGAGRYTQHFYDGYNRETARFVAGEGWTYLAYAGSSERLPSEVTHPNGKKTLYTLSNHLISRKTDPDGVLTYYTHDSMGRLTTEQDGVPGSYLITRYRYDSAGRLWCTEYPGATCPDGTTPGTGRYTTTTYDSAGLVAATRAADGGITSYTYDAAGRVLTTTDPTGAVTTNHYAPGTGYLVAVDMPGELVAGVTTYNTWHYAYDANGNRTCEAAPGGTCPNSAGTGGVQPYTLTTYGPLGRVLSTTNELGQTTSYAYDAAGNQTEVHNPDSSVTKTAYDAAGRVIQTIDAANRVTTTAYDELGRVTCVAEPGGSCDNGGSGPITTTTYDEYGRVATKTDAAGVVTSYTYTDAGRQKTVTTSGKGTVTTTYDGFGRVWKTSNLLGAVTTTTYDEFGEPTQVTSPTGLVTSTTYDDAGRALTTTDPDGVVTTRTYSLRGELLTEQRGTQGNITYTYNPDSTIRTVTDALGRTTSYRYDGRGNRTKRTNALGLFETWTYDGTDQVLIEADQRNRQTVHTYWNDPPNGHKERVADPSGRATTTAYNPDGSVSTKAFLGGATLTYDYDTLGHLTSVDDGAATWGYEHDPTGRLTGTQYDPSSPTAWTRYIYDLAGRRTGVDDSTYTYDALGRLVSISQPAPSGAGDAPGTISSTPVAPGSTPLGLRAVAVDAAGNVFYVNYARIMKYATDGTTTVVDGTGVVGSIGDGGLAKYARLNTPTGLAFDPAGNPTSWITWRTWCAASTCPLASSPGLPASPTNAVTPVPLPRRRPPS
jgi:YD repeat-containing protein